MGLEDSATNADAVKQVRRHEKDSGSPEAQVATLTKHLEDLAKHFERHTQDLHSQRGMFKLITRRKRLLQYLRKKDVERYKTLINALGLRK